MTIFHSKGFVKCSMNLKTKTMNIETEFPIQELMDIWHAEQNYWKNDRNVELEDQYNLWMEECYNAEN